MGIKKVATCDFCGFTEDMRASIKGSDTGGLLPKEWTRAQIRVEGKVDKTWICCPEHSQRLINLITGPKLEATISEGFKRG